MTTCATIDIESVGASGQVSLFHTSSLTNDLMFLYVRAVALIYKKKMYSETSTAAHTSGSRVVLNQDVLWHILLPHQDCRLRHLRRRPDELEPDGLTPADMKACAVVCRAWSEVVLRILWKNISSPLPLWGVLLGIPRLSYGDSYIDIVSGRSVNPDH